MSIETMAAGLVALLKGVTGFTGTDPVQVAEEDYTVLNKGIAKGIVIKYGGHRVEPIALSGGQFIYYQFEIQIFEQYKNPASTINDLRDDAQLVETRIYQYRKLNGVAGVKDARVTDMDPSADLPEELINPPNRWRMAVVRCEVLEENTTQYAE